MKNKIIDIFCEGYDAKVPEIQELFYNRYEKILGEPKKSDILPSYKVVTPTVKKTLFSKDLTSAMQQAYEIFLKREEPVTITVTMTAYGREPVTVGEYQYNDVTKKFTDIWERKFFNQEYK